ncbi:MAG: bifunctional adenosylcobinamide kinase/adenosylcobinamide-phosphate guanylyltransferase [Gemmataceae bacterium]
MAHLTLVLGGVRSGKSRWAEQLARLHEPVIYLAAAGAGDAEMAERIAWHRRRRQEQTPTWQTIEEPWDVARVLATHEAGGCLLLECLTLWVSNRLTGYPRQTPQEPADIQTAVAQLVDVAQTIPARVIIVSNETGCGIMPANALARRFQDTLGEANQVVAAAAREVYHCVAGIATRIK